MVHTVGWDMYEQGLLKSTFRYQVSSKHLYFLIVTGQKIGSAENWMQDLYMYSKP